MIFLLKATRMLPAILFAFFTAAFPVLVFAQEHESVFVVNNSDCGYAVPNYGNGLGNCPSGLSSVGGLNVSPTRSCGYEVNGTDFDFTRRNALVASGWMVLCSTFAYKQPNPTETPNDTVLIINKSEGYPPDYGNGLGNCPVGLAQRGFFRVENQVGNSQSARDYRRVTRRNATLALCTPPQSNDALLVWSNDCEQAPEKNSSEACLGINKGGFHVGLGVEGCSKNEYYGVSASGKAIKSGWMYLCSKPQAIAKPTVSPQPQLLQPEFIPTTPDDGTAFNFNQQKWFFVNVSAGRTGFQDYFKFDDVNESETFKESIRAMALLRVMHGFPNGVNESMRANETFKKDGNVSRADASVFLVKALNLQLDASGGQQFADVPPTHPAYAAVQTLYNKQVAGGCVGNLFCENASITRAAFSAWIAHALALPDIALPAQPTYCDVNPADSFYSVIENITRHGIAVGAAAESCPANCARCFLPNRNITRGEMTKMLLAGSRTCLLEINSSGSSDYTNLTMSLGTNYTFCHTNFTSVTQPTAGKIEYRYRVWVNDALGYWNASDWRTVSFYVPSCRVVVEPSYLGENGESAVRVEYILSSPPSPPPQVDCGNGQTVYTQCPTTGTEGACVGTSNCSYAGEPQDFTVTSSITAGGKQVSCTPAIVSLRKLPKVSFLDARCPSELVTANEANVSVELMREGTRSCNSSIVLGVKITDSNGFITVEEYPKQNWPLVCGTETSNLNVFTINTSTDGLYEVNASLQEFESSNCRFRAYHKRAASVPELDTLTLLAVFTLAFFFLRTRCRRSQARACTRRN